MGEPEFSIVVPTYQRRDLVVALMRSLATLEGGIPFECIVVADGSTDGTAATLRALDLPFPLEVIEQPNAGASSARNQGARAARGEYLLFIDDDMEAHPQLLVEHRRSHREGADVVLGHLPLHPDTPDTLISRGVDEWAEARRARLEAGGQLTLHDILTGQISLPRALFADLHGFDGRFTEGGSYGNEDIDLGHRLLQQGARVVFNPSAITWQNYVVGPKHYLKQWQDAGKADVAFARKHPDRATDLFKANDSHRARRYWRPMAKLWWLTTPIAEGLRRLALYGFDRARDNERWARLFFNVRDMLYWRGVGQAGGMPKPQPVAVLCFHAVTDLSGAGFLAPYGLPPEELAAHLDALLASGHSFIDGTQLHRYLTENAPLPRKPVLVTFDDCYTDLRDVALPILQERSIPAIGFAVSGELGGTNSWDVAKGGRAMSLLDQQGLEQLRRGGIEIGAHTRTHPELPRLSDAELIDEVAGSKSDLDALGVGPIRSFAYTFGEHDRRVQAATEAAGYTLGFALNDSMAQFGGDRFAIPRFEVRRRDSPRRLRSRMFWSRLGLQFPQD
jgi:glycosyltransferase involved in cell wall biosynthesis/peptidoglycan/xylan/chitin deacetylase (PgdA/CDA1 family)